jgi:hypothetical protein
MKSVSTLTKLFLVLATGSTIETGFLGCAAVEGEVGWEQLNV